MTVGEDRDGTTIEVAVGQVVAVSLDSTYWQIATADRTDVLESVSGPTTVRGSCGPGEGCGVVTRWFRALAAGTATVRATRTSCGEARACSPAEATFEIRIVVH